MASFKEAFKAARKRLGPGKTFEWNGKRYTTDLKEEKGTAVNKTVRPKARPEPTRPKARPTTKATPVAYKDAGPITVTKLPPADTSKISPPNRAEMKAKADKMVEQTKAKKAALKAPKPRPKRGLWQLGWPFRLEKSTGL